MAQTPQLVPAEYPEHIQKFLFACSFWIIAADEQLTAGEQRWLTEQFGARKTGMWLDEMAASQGAVFYQVFDKLAAGLGENDKRRIYPGLVAWLKLCSASDAAGAASEEQVIAKIKARLSLDEQITKLTHGQGTRVQATIGQAAPRPPAVPAAPRPAISSQAKPQVQPVPVPEQIAPVSVPARMLRGHGGAVTCACFDARGTTVFSGSLDRTVRSWDVSAAVETRTFVEQEAGVTALASSPAGIHLFSGNMYGTVIRWNAGNGGRTWQAGREGGSAISAIAVSGEGEIIASASESGIVTIMSAEDGHEVKVLGNTGAPMRDVCFSRVGKLLLCCGDDRGVQSWDGSESLASRFAGHQGAVFSVRISPDGLLAASGAADKTVKLWEVSSGRELRTLAGHGAAVSGVAFSPDGLFLAAIATDGIVKAWEVGTGRQIYSHRLATQQLTCIAFNPAGSNLIVSGADNNLYLVEHIVPQQAGA